MDPFLSADALLDSDGDGDSNLTEYEQGSDLSNDDIPPVIDIDQVLVIDAVARLTSVDFSLVTATDAKDGLVDASVNPSGPFSSGSHVLEWTAADAAGNVAIANQTLKVLPIVTIALDQKTGEGAPLEAGLLLSGEAPDYPVVVHFELSGTADDTDFSGLAGSVEIAHGVSGSLSFDVVADEKVEDDESLVITLLGAEGAVLGARISHTVTITEQNLSPTGQITVSQSEEARGPVFHGEGSVTVTADVSDRNPSDVLSYDWSATSNAIVLSATDSRETSFDPETVVEGSYWLRVNVSDDAEPVGMTSLYRIIKVESDSVELLGSNDTDGDGISDRDEGLVDSDGDGIEDYRDSDENTSVLPVSEIEPKTVLQTEAGLRLRLGETSLAANKRGGLVTDTDLLLVVDDTQMPFENTTDEGFEHPLGLFDFEIDQLPAGGSVAQIVLPLPGTIPENAQYRKYSTTSGWQEFVEDGVNAVASASVVNDVCPPIGDPSYEDGLNEGGSCVLLAIVDGGLNDADGVRNGSISDPGAVSVLAPDTTPPVLETPENIQISSDTAISSSNGEVQSFLNAASCSDENTGDLSIEHDAPTDFASGTVTTVTFRCADAAENTTTATATVTIAQLKVVGEATEPSSEGAGCFIATAAYGSYLAPEVFTLRQFRDEYLITNRPGQLFVALYYKYSPSIAEVIAQNEGLKIITRLLLTPIVWAVNLPWLILLLLLLFGLRRRLSTNS